MSAARIAANRRWVGRVSAIGLPIEASIARRASDDADVLELPGVVAVEVFGEEALAVVQRRPVAPDADQVAEIGGGDLQDAGEIHLIRLDDATARASYRVVVTEGPQYRMGALVLTGLSLEGERRILAAWKIPDGAVFDASVLDAFINGGARAAFGDLPWGYEKIGHYLQKDPKTAKVDVLMDFQ